MRSGPPEAAIGGSANRTSFPGQSSVLEEEALLKPILRAYGTLALEECRFLERGHSVTYHIEESCMYDITICVVSVSGDP